MRVGLDVSIRAFNKAGSARYAHAIQGALEARAAEEGLTVIPLSLPDSIRETRPGAKRKAVTTFWELVYAPWLLPALCRRHGFDLLHTTIPMPVGTLPCPLVATVHDALPMLYPQWFSRVMGMRLRRWFLHTLRRADHLVASSNSTVRDIRTFAPTLTTPITTVYLGAHLPPLTEADVPHDGPVLSASKPYILFLGTLEPRKNLATVLEAYRLLRQRLPQAPSLMVVGGRDWLAEDTQAYIERLGIAAHVHLAGFVSDAQLPQLYRQASMLVFPSLYEGFGFPPLEAMSYGCPVIASNVSSLPEIVGDAGLLVEPTDAAGIAEAMHSVLTTPELAQRLRKEGPEWARHFSWERCAGETIAVYRQTLVAAQRQPTATAPVSVQDAS